jgi:hypothetical protein
MPNAECQMPNEMLPVHSAFGIRHSALAAIGRDRHNQAPHPGRS